MVDPVPPRVALDGGSPFDFVWRVPPAPLDRVVEAVWHARGGSPGPGSGSPRPGRPWPCSCWGAPILETPDDGAGPTLRAERGFLLRPHDRLDVTEPTGATHAVGIVTTPVGSPAVFGRWADHLRGRAVDLETHWPSARDLRRRLVADDDVDRRLDLLLDHIAATIDLDVPALDRCEAAVTHLEDDPTRPIADVASSVGISHAQLGRDFARVVGLSPRVLARLLRVRRLLRTIDVHGESPGPRTPTTWGGTTSPTSCATSAATPA